VPRYDVVVVGAGIVGLASAREILKRRPGTTLAVLDKEPEIAAHQTGHNSGVIHSGIYYTPGSLKAQLCVSGSREMYAYCADKGIPTDRCGKLIVAADESELPALENLYQRGTANGVAGLEVVGPEGIRELEPHCVGAKAIWSPNTGIVDYRQVAAAFASDVCQSGGEILTGHRVDMLRESPASVEVQTSRGELEAGRVIVCAGVYSDRLARRSGASAEPKIVPFRGDYWQLRPDRRHLARNLIYPVPDPSFPFLGVHFTRRIEDGAVWIGPNAVLAFSREGYRRLQIRPSDLLESLTYRGFLRLAFRYWLTGSLEMYRDFSKRAFLETCQKYIPEMTVDDMVPGPSGVRAQALAPNGALVDDFVVNVHARQMHVRNAPSPAATSSLAIGRLVADAFEQAAGV
jgi:L-2-hydroxyglutarate oxidase